MTRGVEDAMFVLHAITGPDAGDVASVPSHLDFDACHAAAESPDMDCYFIP